MKKIVIINIMFMLSFFLFGISVNAQNYPNTTVPPTDYDVKIWASFKQGNDTFKNTYYYKLGSDNRIAIYVSSTGTQKTAYIYMKNSSYDWWNVQYLNNSVTHLYTEDYSAMDLYVASIPAWATPTDFGCNVPVFNNQQKAYDYINAVNPVYSNDYMYYVPDGYVVDSNGNLVPISLLPHEYSSNVPTPSNVRVKYVMPSGLFPADTQSHLKVTWQPNAGQLHTEISIQYNYTVSGTKYTKLLPYTVYDDNLWSSVGSFDKKMQDDIENYIHTKNHDTANYTFANGKLNLTGVYVRYSLFNSSISKIQYGNWVKISLMTGGSIDDNNPQSTYNEVTLDSDGNETIVHGGEYDNTVIDNKGNLVDPSKLSSLQDYLLAIPNILGSFFSSINGLISSIGSFGAFFTVAFGALPPVVPLVLVAAIFAIVAVGIIKLFK